MTTLTQVVAQHIDYNYWANRRIWGCVMALTAEQFNRPLDYSQGAICNQIVHTMWAEDVWLSRITGDANPTYTSQDFENRTAIRTAWDALEAKVFNTITSMDETQLTQRMGYQNSSGTEFQQTVLQIVLHLVNHGTDHRAQTLAMMHMLGAETVEQDLIHYYRENPGV